MKGKDKSHLHRFIPYLVIWVFFVFLAIQMFLVFVHDFTAWKGGGFGMFSAIDDRSLKVKAYTSDGEVYDDFDEVFDDDLRLIRKLPMNKYFDRFSDRVRYSDWYYDPEEKWLTDYKKDEDSFVPVTLVKLEMQVWEVIYDKKNHTAVPNIMEQHVYDLIIE